MNKYKPYRKLVALVLSAVMVLTTGPIDVFAQISNLPISMGGEIITFMPIDDSMTNQEVPLGTSLEELTLPNNLAAMTKTLESVPPTGSTESSIADSLELAGEENTGADDIGNAQVIIEVPVEKWVSEPEFDSETIGTYVFTPVFNEAWSLADGAEPPTITMQVVLGIMPLTSTGSIIDLNDSDAALSAGATASGGKYSYNAAMQTLTIYSGPVTVTGRTTDRQIKIGGTTTVILDNVTIDVSALNAAAAIELQAGADVTMTLQGNNVLKSGKFRAGINVSSGMKLTINAADSIQSLDVVAGQDGAGIGGNSNAYLSGLDSKGGHIKINGGFIKATGGGGAAVGGGFGSDSGIVEISGGIVIANGTNGGAGIGGGTSNGPNGTGSGAGGIINISGGTITATGGNAAGIGSGAGTNTLTTNGNGGTITISGGTVTATANTGAGIGIGRASTEAGTSVTITGGTVNASRIQPQPTNGSTPVYLNTLTVGNPNIGDNKTFIAMGYDSTLPYGSTDVVTNDGGKLYLWLPQNSSPAARVDVIPDAITMHTKVWARTGASETQTLLRDGNVVNPVISTQPSGGTFTKDSAATALTVAAGITDEGTLSYQWYRNSQNNTTGGTPVGTNSSSYIPPTSAVGTLYYYCVVTNTNESVAGQQTATAISSVAAVTTIAAPAVGAITAPAAVSEGQPLTLVNPTSDDNGDVITAQGWEISTNGTTGWTAFNPATVMDFSYNDQYLRFFATNSVGSSYSSNTVQIKVKIAPTVGSITAPATVAAGSLVGLSTPSVAANNAAVSSEGWEISLDGSTNWSAFDPTIPITLADHESYIRYMATNSEGTSYSSNTVQIKVIAEPTVAAITFSARTFYGGTLSLTPPVITDNNDPVTAEGWEVSADGSTGWTAFNPLTPLVATYQGQYLRYFATNSVGTGYSSNTVQIQLYNTGGGGAAPLEPVIDTTMPTVAAKSVAGKVKNGTLTITITKQMAKNAIQAATERIPKGKEANGIAVVFTANGSGTWSSLTANLQAGAIDQLKEAKVKYITIGSKRIDISLDTKAITQIDQQSSGTVALSAKKVTKLSSAAKKAIGSRPVFDITLRYTKNGKAKTIANLGGGTATIGIAYSKKTSDSGSLWGVYVKSNGKVEWLPKSSYTGGKLVFNRTSLSIYGIGYKAVSEFTDTAGLWSKDAIHQMVSRGLLTGTTKQTFAPDQAITRAELVVALGKLVKADVSGYKKSRFTDVKAEDPAMPYIEWAVANQIMEGTGNQQFGPDQAITREQMALMMRQFAKATKYELPVSREYDRFADDSKLSSSTKETIKRIVQAGLMSGKKGNQFDPQGKATRAEAAVILQRFIDLVINEGTARGMVQNDSGQWLHYDAEGKRTIGWLELSGNKYYFDKEGVRVAGKWHQIEGKWYYFDANGKLLRNTKVDGYLVDQDGVRK